MQIQDQEIMLKGIPICRGVAIGIPLILSVREAAIQELVIADDEVEGEINRYRAAFSQSKEDIRILHKKLKNEQIQEGAAILDAHLQIMEDPLLTEQVEGEIRISKRNAAFVFHRIVAEYQKKFQSMADPYFRERFKDIQDICRRVMSYLCDDRRHSLAEIPMGSIVFSPELSATDAAEAKASCIGAFATAGGGPTSHAAIMAKAKGIPYVTGIPLEKLAGCSEGSEVIVDGRTGYVILHPSTQTLARYKRLKDNVDAQTLQLSKNHALQPETIDGCRVLLSANIDMTEDVDIFHQHGGKRVGLFRSEYLFLASDTFPTEEEQFQIYKRLVKKMKGLPIVIRTFDFGGDKLSLNPQITYQGFRAIRFLLKEREIFKAQLRAILRAGLHGDVSVMFPMISTLSELVDAKKLLEEARDELSERGIEAIPQIRIGSMIEVPSAAIVADLIAKECDFVSIGTNDLVQYSLAADRRGQPLNSLYASADPSVLRMIRLIVTEASQQGIQVTVCGEIAADPRFTSLLLGLGVHEFSVAPLYIPSIKQAIRNTCFVEAVHLAEAALALTDARDIVELLQKEYQRNNPEDELYNI